MSIYKAHNERAVKDIDMKIAQSLYVLYNPLTYNGMQGYAKQDVLSNLEIKKHEKGYLIKYIQNTKLFL